MRIVCPSCEATYDVPDATLGSAARQVRCVRCSTVWQVDPTLEPEDPIEVHPDADLPPPIAIPREVSELAPPPQPMSATHRLPRTLKPSGGMTTVVIAWLLSFAILGAAGWAAVIWRAAIMHSWEPSMRLYQWLGLG